MNKRFFICLFILVPMLMGACDFLGESDKNENRETKTIEVFPDSVRQHIIEQDSLARELISKIDTLTTELNATKKEVEILRADMKELKAPGRMLVIFALLSLLMSIIAIILVILRTNEKVERWEAKDIVNQSIREQNRELVYRMNRAETNIKDINKGLSESKSGSTNNSIDKRLSDLEVKVNRMAGAPTSPIPPAHSYPSFTHSTTDSKENQESEYAKTGYAKVNSNKYFVEIFNSKQEECVYTIKFNSKEEGEFDIISLEKIKSINGLKDVVDLTSDSCLLEEATNYKVVKKGRCKKADDKVWVVTEKLVIKVSR